MGAGDEEKKMSLKFDVKNGQECFELPQTRLEFHAVPRVTEVKLTESTVGFHAALLLTGQTCRKYSLFEYRRIHMDKERAGGGRACEIQTREGGGGKKTDSICCCCCC